MDKIILSIIGVLALVGVGLGISNFNKQPTSVTTFSGTTADEFRAPGFIFSAESGTNQLVIDGVDFQIAAGANQANWQNLTGRQVTVQLADVGISVGDTASSSYLEYLIATSTATISDGFDIINTLPITVLDVDNFLIFENTIATSTTASTTSSSDFANQQRGGQPSLVVPIDWYVIHYIKKLDDNTCLVTGICGGATSSDRGIDPFARILFTSTTTSKLGR